MPNAITITISGASDSGCGVLASEIELYLKTLGLTAQWADNPHVHPLTTEERAQALARHRPQVRIVKTSMAPKKIQRLRTIVAGLESAKREDDEERGYRILSRVAHNQSPEGLSYVELLTECRERGLSPFVSQCHRWYDKKVKK